LTPKLNQTAWSGVKALLLVQVGLTVGMAVISGVFSGWLAFYSACLAGICCIISTAVFAAIVFKKAGARAAAQIARSFFRAEAVKWLITIILMTVIFLFVPIVAGAFFAAFCVVQMAYWFSPSLGFFKD
jgi:ATP synthase protein I